MSKFKPNQRSGALQRSPRRVPAPLDTPPVIRTDETSRRRAPSTEPATPTEAEPPSGIQRIGFNTLLLYIFFRFSFLHEFISGKLGVDTHIIITLSVVCYLCSLLSGHITEALRDKITWMWLGFGFCMCIATTTSFWHGGSFPILMNFLRTALPIIVVVPALTRTRKDVIKLLSTMGVACITTVFLGLLNNDFKTGRMSINTINSEIQDSNDYAAHLILMLPALAFILLRPGKSALLKVLGAALISASMYEILSTGSRGGLLSLAITALFIAVTGGHKLRAGILIGLPILALAALPFIPKESAARLKTLVSSSSASAANAEEAKDSSDARIELLQQSWKMTLQHPLFGIGPGEFMDYQAQDAKSAGQRGMWHVTHNAYTQISSECGVPALIFYLASVFMTFGVFRKAGKLKGNELALPCTTLNVMIIGFSICIFFLSLAYTVQMVVMSAIAVTVRSLIDRESEQSATAVTDEVAVQQAVLA